jgi:hypothetical protein
LKESCHLFKWTNPHHFEEFSFECRYIIPVTYEKKLYHAIWLKATAAIPKNSQKQPKRSGAYETYEKAWEKKISTTNSAANKTATCSKKKKLQQLLKKWMTG